LRGDVILPVTNIKTSCTLSAKEVIEGITPKDEFLFSTSEFVSPATTAIYVKNKGAYLLFRMPEINTTIVPEMGIWFKVTCFALGAILTFKGEIFKVFIQNETTHPCIIIKIPSEIAAEPAKLETALSDCNIAVIWRKTGSIKQGSIIHLTSTRGIFETSNLSLTIESQILLTFKLNDFEFNEIEAIVQKVGKKQGENGNTLLEVNFTFKNQTEQMKTSILTGIEVLSQ
jgi:hypothetical protein